MGNNVGLKDKVRNHPNCKSFFETQAHYIIEFNTDKGRRKHHYQKFLTAKDKNGPRWQAQTLRAMYDRMHNHSIR